MKRKTIETMIYGDEPTFDKLDYSKTEFITFINWYNYNASHDDIKNYTLAYLKEYNANLIPLVEDVPKTIFNKTLGTLCRMVIRGYPWDDYILQKINDQLALLIEYAKEKQLTKVITEKPKRIEINIVDVHIDYIEGYIDNCISTGNFVSKDWNKYCIENKLKNADAIEIGDYFKSILSQLVEDRESYENLTKKNYDKFVSIITNIVDTFTNYVVLKPKRKMSPKPVDLVKLTQKVKFLVEYPELGLVSIAPKEIIGTNYVLLYDTKYRKLQLICGNNLTIRGSTVYNINKESSISKIVKQPDIIRHKFMAGDFPYVLGSFGLLKTKAQTPSGAINANTLILRTLK